MEGGEQKKTTFSFKKVSEKRDFRTTGDRRFAKEAAKVHEEEDEVAPTPKKKLVIPLPEDGEWGQVIKKMQEDKEKKDSEGAAVPENLNPEDAAAVQALIAESKSSLKQWEDEQRDSTTSAIRVKESGDLKEKNFGEEATLDDYDSIPVEEFGVAMLRGMGMSEEEYQEIKSKEPEEVRPWPVGLGLGAAAKFARKNRGKNGDGDDDEQTLKPGVLVKIDSGSHSGHYGKVEGLDADRGVVMIQLALSGEIITKSEVAVSVVTKEEYSKESKVINKDTFEQYKKRDAWLKLMGRKEEAEEDPLPKKPIKKEEPRVKTEEDRKSRDSKDRHGTSDYKSGRVKKDLRKRESPPPPPKERRRPWVQPRLRVRLISSKYKGGKYYNAKLTVEDVPSPDQCVCITDENRLLDDVDPRDLETVIPRDSDSPVMVVRGEYRGRIGRIIRRLRDKCIASVELEGTRGRIVDLNFDDICQLGR